MSGLDALDPPELARVQLGSDPAAAHIAVVKPLTLGKLPAFARALQPIADEIQAILAADIDTGTVMGLVANRFDDLIAALEVATGAPRAAIEAATLDQGLELVLAVLQANRGFFKGRAASALRMAAVISGAGPTPSRSSSAPAGPSKKSRASTSTS